MDGPIDKVTVEATGDDALFIDKLRLYQMRVDLIESQWTDQACKANNGTDAQCLRKESKWQFTDTPLREWGMDGGKGYCSSTEANADISGKFLDAMGCNKILDFWVESKKVTARERGAGHYLPAGYLSVFNQAGYVTEHVLTYLVPKDVAGQTVPMPVVYSGKLSAGFSKEYVIPANATNVFLQVDGIAVLDSLDFKKSYATGTSVNACFKFWGTIFDTEAAAVECD